jgi:hypothetical protein
MTTTVIVHNAHRDVTVITEDRVYDHAAAKMTDEWQATNRAHISAGQLYQTYCTDTRRIVVVEENAKG